MRALVRMLHVEARLTIAHPTPRVRSNKAGHVNHDIAHVASSILVDFTASISFE